MDGDEETIRRLQEAKTEAAVRRALKEAQDSQVLKELRTGFDHLDKRITTHIGDLTHIPMADAQVVTNMIASEKRRGILGGVVRTGFGQVIAILGMLSLLVGLALGIVEFNAISHSLSPTVTPSPSHHP